MIKQVIQYFTSSIQHRRWGIYQQSNDGKESEDMTGREKLMYLINGLLEGEYDISVFCDEFSRIFDLEMDYKELTEEEMKELNMIWLEEILILFYSMLQ